MVKALLSFVTTPVSRQPERARPRAQQSPNDERPGTGGNSTRSNVAAPGTGALRAGVLVLVLTSALSAKDLTDYQIGDVAGEDLITPVALTVMDPDATEALKQKEAAQMPVVVCLYTSTADDVDARFREAFTKTRGSFLSAVQKAFGRRKLNAQDLASIEFDQLAETFQKKNKLFPLDPIRAALWAGGDADKTYEASLAATLRRMMTAPIRPDPPPAEFRANGPLRLVPMAEATAMLTPQIIEQQGTNVSASQFASLADVRQKFQELFVSDERPVGKYLATLLKPNCAVDADATRQWRAQRTETIVATAQYAAGDVLARRGQVVDRKVKAALDQVREKAVLGQLQQRAAAVQPTPAAVTGSPGQIHWLIGLLAIAILILALAVWQLARRRQHVSLLPMPMGGPLDASADSWQQRALVAEQRADKAQAMVRAGVLGHLARWLSENLVQRLISQRRHLLENQQVAVAEMAELEARLEKVQAPLKDRLHAYERRIADLEKELAIKGEENRELIKAKIQMARKQLEAEREKNRVELN